MSSLARFEEELARALEGVAGLRIPPETIEAMAALDAMLVHWAARLDLVGFRTAEQRIRRYFAEPLAASLQIGNPSEALDIGSGGGSPALPLALCRRQSRFTLMEPRRRKALFLEEAVRHLGLENVAVRPERFETCEREGSLDLVTTRGVRWSASGLDEVTKCLRPGGRFLWFSGEARLGAALGDLSRSADMRLLGPERLLPGGEGRLLVVEKAA